MINVELIQSNWETYQGLLNKLGDTSVANLLEDLGQRLCEAAATIHKDENFSYPGGLISSKLAIAKHMIKHNKIENIIWTSSDRTIIKVALLHDIGRLGNLTANYLLEQDSDWHIEKLGKLYKPNIDLGNMSCTERTLFLLQHYSVSLSEEEFLAILSLSDKDTYTKNNLGNLLAYSRSRIFRIIKPN